MTQNSINFENLNDVKSKQKKKNFKKGNRMYILISLLTIDEYSDEAKISIVGYSYFPLFLNCKTDVECTKSSDKDFYLNHGHFQIPVYKDSFQSASETIDIKKISSEFERIPSCTICLRVYKSGETSSKSQIRSRNMIEMPKEY